MTTRMETGNLVGQLDALVAKWRLLGHPFYQAWTAGTLTREALQLYAEQYYHHVKAFPENLRTLAGRTEGGLRGIIEENLAEEENPVAPHPKLWREFAEAVGVAEARMDESTPLPGIEKLLATYRQQASQGSAAAAVAALYVYEAQVPEIATKKIEGLKKFYRVTELRGLRYFAVHEEADVRHRAAWKQWLAQQPAEEVEPVLRAGEEALQALWGALDAVTPEGCCGLRPPHPSAALRAGQPSAER